MQALLHLVPSHGSAGPGYVGILRPARVSGIAEIPRAAAVTGIAGILRAAGFAGIVAALGVSPPAHGSAGEDAAAAPPAAAEMILLPGGDFTMGKDGFGDYSPAHRVRVSPFHIDKHEVTNAEYQRFCEATGHALPFFWGIDRFCSGPAFPDHPVVGVSWQDAQDYAAWRGARLPTEAEWEYAARGGLEGKNYAQSDEFDSTLYAPTGEHPSPVGSRPPNGFGLYDMTGNVCEWVQDCFGEDYYKTSPAENPTGPYGSGYRVIRGGGWHTGPWCSRVHARYSLKSNWLDFNVGFRCARPAGESAATRIEEIIRAEGIDRGLAAYREMRAAAPGAWYFDELELNEMAYHLIPDSLVAAAVMVLEWNLEAHPDSYNAWDSVAEGYALLGRKDDAVRCYRKALELNPACRTARAGLEKLGVE
jgi:sulfatase modifying factor 1